MDAAEARRTAAQQARISEDEIRLQRQREGIELSKVRILRELNESSHPRRREQLAAALAYLENQLSGMA